MAPLNLVDCLSVKISLLGLINGLPENPSANELPKTLQSKEPRPGRILPPGHEISITQQLAFLSGYSNESSHVLAVCVEEASSGDSLIIRLAANTGKHEQFLDRLRMISHVLENEASDVNRSTNGEALSELVLRMSRMRIYSRIRSRHGAWKAGGKARGKASIVQRLITAQELLKNSSIPSASAKSLSDKIQSLQGYFEQLESTALLKTQSPRSEKNLFNLLKCCRSIFEFHKEDLQFIPYTPGLWSGDATESLIGKLSKLSQYTSAGEELLRAARRYKVFLKISVEFVDLQQCGKRLSETGSSETDDIITASCTTDILATVSNRQAQSMVSVRDNIKKRLAGTSSLHAEIQLLIYCESIRGPTRPRVICSSKCSCYLCNVFFRIHGAYFTPSSHGRLYETWRWPDLAQLPAKFRQGSTTIDLERCLLEFSQSIDRKISESLGSKLPKRADPLESRVDLIDTLTPSVVSRASQTSRSAPTTVATADGVASPVLRNTGNGPLGDTHLSTQSGSDEISYKPTLRAGDSERSYGPIHAQGNEGSDDIRSNRLCLDPGEIASHTFDSTDQMLLIHLPKLHLSVQYDVGGVEDEQLDEPVEESRLRIEVECLSSSAHSTISGRAQILDLGGDEWTERPVPDGCLFASEGLLLARGRTLVRLRARRPLADNRHLDDPSIIHFNRELRRNSRTGQAQT